MNATTAINNRNGRFASLYDCILKYYHPHRCRATLRFNPEGGPPGGIPLHRQGENRYAVDPNIEIRFQMRDGRAT